MRFSIGQSPSEKPTLIKASAIVRPEGDFDALHFSANLGENADPKLAAYLKADAKRLAAGGETVNIAIPGGKAPLKWSKKGRKLVPDRGASERVTTG